MPPSEHSSLPPLAARSIKVNPIKLNPIKLNPIKVNPIKVNHSDGKEDTSRSIGSPLHYDRTSTTTEKVLQPEKVLRLKPLIW